MPIDIALLAAGYGTRLRPISDALPKPLVHVGHEPLLTNTLLSLRQALKGTGAIGVNAHHRAEKILAWGAAENVRVATEDPIRGTAGGVKGITDKLGSQGDVLVVNGDIYGFKDWKGLVEAHATSGDFATLLVTDRPLDGVASYAGLPGEEDDGSPNARRELGNVGLDARRGVVRLRKEQLGGEVESAYFTGIYVLSSRGIALLPEVGCAVEDLFLPALRRGERIGVHRTSEPLVDIGTPAGLLRANQLWLGEHPRWIGPSARVAVGVQVERCVIAGVVEGEGMISDVVVLPNSTCRAPLSRAIVFGREILPVS